MKMVIQALIRDYGIDPGHVFYCSLDFYGLEHHSILEIVEEFLKIQKISTSEKSFLFLDEVACKEGFNLQLKNLYDAFNVKIYASSSSASKKVYAGDVGIRNAVTGSRDLGAIFENLVFFAIKHKRPCYLLKDGVEIDFLTEDRWLIKAKYNRELTDKQARLFESVDATRRLVIDSMEGLQRLREIQDLRR